MFQVIFCPFFSYMYWNFGFISCISYRPHALPILSLIQATSLAHSFLYWSRALPISSHRGHMPCPPHSTLFYIYNSNYFWRVMMLVSMQLSQASFFSSVVKMFSLLAFWTHFQKIALLWFTYEHHLNLVLLFQFTRFYEWLETDHWFCSIR